jgi:hypothetical protein
MYFSRPKTPAKIDKTSTDVAISLIFISGTYQCKLVIFMDSVFLACEFGQKIMSPISDLNRHISYHVLEKLTFSAARHFFTSKSKS